LEVSLLISNRLIHCDVSGSFLLGTAVFPFLLALDDLKFEQSVGQLNDLFRFAVLDDLVDVHAAVANIATIAATFGNVCSSAARLTV
jgi:hypothetical protein